MYPKLTDFFRDVFGIDPPFEIYSFGAMVAVAILTATWIASRELDRMYAAGLLPAVRIPAEKGKRGKREAWKEVSPSAIMGVVTVIAVFGGFGGAKIFHILENLPDFFRSPGRMLFSRGGFTFYGGLIVAGGSIAYYVRRKGLSIGRFCDAAAPTVMLAYGIGRIGCHLAGDGDWGIASDPAAKPSFLPMWLWAETYPRNIYFNDPVPPGGYVPLDTPVFPTPLYEFAAAVLIFGVLWALRKHTHAPGWLFYLYLVFAGVERFLIEKIRVNNEFDLFGMMVTQAEVISTLLVLVGVAGMTWTWSPRGGGKPATTPDAGSP